MLVLMSGTALGVDISSCTTISSPGTYNLTTDILSSSATQCIIITSSNVVFDGGNHRIQGRNTTNSYGIHVGSGSTLSNVVVRNIRVEHWYYGIYFDDVDYSTIEDNTYSYNYKGIYLEGDYNNIKITTPTDYALAKIIEKSIF